MLLDLLYADSDEEEEKEKKGKKEKGDRVSFENGASVARKPPSTTDRAKRGSKVERKDADWFSARRPTERTFARSKLPTTANLSSRKQ